MQVSEDVLAVISNLAIDGNTITMTKLERSLYLKVDQVLQAMGGKWNRKAKAHVFTADPAPIVEQVLTLGEVTTNKDLGHFPTEPKLAAKLVKMAAIKPGDCVLEPSAGSGALIDAIVETGAAVWAIERDTQRRNRLINSWATDQKRFNWQTRVSIVVSPTVGFDDFMEYETVEPFDACVMNPPFCKVGLGDHLDHVRHAYSMIAPGGRLVAVLPQGVLFRKDKRHTAFREWSTDTIGGMYEELPEDSFKESGTGVRTCVLTVTRR